MIQNVSLSDGKAVDRNMCLASQRFRKTGNLHIVDFDVGIEFILRDPKLFKGLLKSDE